MNQRTSDATWQDPGRGPEREELFNPRTQIVTDREAYLGQGRHDVGRRIADDQVEMFVSGDVAHALQREFVQHSPEFIAVHDVGTSASLRLLTSLAGAAGARVQRLSVRRQGHGVALAVLQFVEMPLSDGVPVRVYATDVQADSATRGAIARVLLAFSRLGVLLVGELPPHMLATQLTPLHEGIQHGPWHNRELLMVPLGSSTALAAPAAQLAGHGPVAVHVTPHADKPRQAWSYIGGAWNRLHAAAAGGHALPTDMAQAVPRPRPPQSEAPTELMPLQPEPPPAPPAEIRAAGPDWQAYAARCALIKGTVAVCVFDIDSAQPLASTGNSPGAEQLAQEGAALLARMNEASAGLGLGPVRSDASIGTGTHYLLLRPLAEHPGIAVHLVLLASGGNLTLARMQLERLQPTLHG